MPFRQAYVDPNTGGTFPASWVVAHVDGLDPDHGTLSLSARRYASIFTYSQGFLPLATTGTQISGQTYASWFAIPVGSAQVALQSAVAGAVGSYLVAAPEFSGATFF